MNEQIRKRLRQVFLDLEKDLKEFEDVRKDIKQNLSQVMEGWEKLHDYAKDQRASDVMRKTMNDVGICYTSHPAIWTGIEDVAFSNLLSKIRTLLSVIDGYNKNNQPSIG